MALRLSPATLMVILQPWTEVAEPIYRRVAHLADKGGEGETLWIGCGSGRSVLWWAQKHRSAVQGLDPDARSVEEAESAVRGTDLSGLATFQVADPNNLPHEDQVFDTVVVHMLYLRGASEKLVLQEASRVARPMATVIALVPSWLQTPRENDAQVIESMGIAPNLPVEWKGYLREAGIVELTVEEAAAEGKWLASGFLPLFVRAWRAGAWAGLHALLSREVRTLRRLARRRVLGLSLIKGTRWPHA